ncbi:hypothetical protein L1887_28485 [Cichorium endivia]|nr:hypothetical protein L1887_28485 [Cichorium endivia]
MELELTLSPPNQRRQPTKKSCHGGNTLTKSPLVSWSQEEDDEPNKTFFTGDYQQDLDGEGQGLNGWPPLHSWRRRLIEGVWFNERVDEEEGDNMNAMNNNYNESLFVKVKMDGVGIARKIDLNAFHSYQMLTTTLLHMFDKYVEIDEDGASYTLMYQHKDGHWLLPGDLPWEMFIGTVQRIRVARN